MTTSIAQATKKETAYIRSHFGLSFAKQFQGTIVWEEIQGRKSFLFIDPQTDTLMLVFAEPGKPQTTAAPAVQFADTATDLNKMHTAKLMLEKFAG